MLVVLATGAPGREVRAVKIIISSAYWKVKFFSSVQCCGILFIYFDWEKIFVIHITKDYSLD